jgi:hypothetical protein
MTMNTNIQQQINPKKKTGAEKRRKGDSGKWNNK